MKTPVATGFNGISPFPLCSWEAQQNENRKNGNRNSPPAPHRQTRPTSVLADWGPASYPDSGLPSSLEEWLASKGALVIG
jgi:hypothetical protein